MTELSRSQLNWRRKLWLGTVAAALISVGASVGWVGNDIHNRGNSTAGLTEVEHKRLLDTCTGQWDNAAWCLLWVEEGDDQGASYNEMVNMLAKAAGWDDEDEGDDPCGSPPLLPC